MPPNQVGGEKQYVLMVTASVGRLNLDATRVTSIDTVFASVMRVASVGRLNLDATRVTSIDTVFASVMRVAFGNPHMAASLSGAPKEKRQVGHRDATAGELAKGDLAEDQL